jgi:pyrroline-5-carboxylate reductase
MPATTAILGAGNIGSAIARGLVAGGHLRAEQIVLTRRHPAPLEELAREGFSTGTDNAAAIAAASTVLLCVQPAQLPSLLQEIEPTLRPERHLVISVVTGVSSKTIRGILADEIPVVRAMPNTAITIGESMTCLAADPVDPAHMAAAVALFDSLGRTMVIDEDLMSEATALCACGVAFFLRAIRAASQGGIEVGFHAQEALIMAAQTARGAASLLLRDGAHPEPEIDKVTTPMGCTIAGLNQMEHEGFSSALIKGIVTSARKAEQLGNAAKK